MAMIQCPTLAHCLQTCPQPALETSLKVTVSTKVFARKNSKGQCFIIRWPMAGMRESVGGLLTIIYPCVCDDLKHFCPIQD